PAPPARAPAPAPAVSSDEDPTLLDQPAVAPATPADDMPGTPPPQEPAPQQPEPEQPEPLAFDSILLTEAVELEPRAPLPIVGEPMPDGHEEPEPEGPIVDGILCERDHFNHPLALYCSSCGVSTVHRTRVPVKGPRPTLGVLIGDDGSAYALDHDYLVGREPEMDPGVESSELRPLRLQDAERSVSRVHAEVRLQDWEVIVVDRGSANGTFVAARGETEWRRLAKDDGEVVAPGTRIAFGKRIMTFDTHHQA
ncbi:MAG: FHA domain-containing protein, partial [Egibacteraceae bacterium]